jgi:mannosyltransferase
MTGQAAVGLSPPPSRPRAAAADRGAEARTGRRSRGATSLNWLVVTIPMLAELVVGGYGIGWASLWRDEGYTREVARRPVGAIVALLGHQDAVHGLYYLGMHLVIAGLGASATVLRLPSLVAAILAAGLTAALGRRLARVAALPSARLIGLLAGLLTVALPLTTWYAQDARPYALVTLCAVGATYLLVRGMTAASRWWWAGYAAVILVLGLLNLAALLLLAAHGVSLVIMRARLPAADQAAGHLRAAPRRWLVAAAAGTAVLIPLIVLARRQADQLNWVSRPDGRTLHRLVNEFAGTKDLVPLVVALALAGVIADVSRHHRAACAPAAITVPWLVLPPVALLAVSQVQPVYVERYIVFCTPALALLTASGLVWLTRLARLVPAGRHWPTLAAVPSALLLAIMVATLVGPQQVVRRTSARVDDLRKVAAIVARDERPGDAILYLPWNTRVVSLTYPRPFQRLNDLGQLASPGASATLEGIPVSAAILAQRFGQVQRLWTVGWKKKPARDSPLYREQLALLHQMHLIGRWQVQSVVLRLYAADEAPRTTLPA